MTRAGKSEPTWVVYMPAASGRSAWQRSPLPRDAAIAKAIERHNIADPERQKRVAVSPME
jgi:hypothetical protein